MQIAILGNYHIDLRWISVDLLQDPFFLSHGIGDFYQKYFNNNATNLIDQRLISWVKSIKSLPFILHSEVAKKLLNKDEVYLLHCASALDQNWNAIVLLWGIWAGKSTIVSSLLFNNMESNFSIVWDDRAIFDFKKNKFMYGNKVISVRSDMNLLFPVPILRSKFTNKEYLDLRWIDPTKTNCINSKSLYINVRLSLINSCKKLSKLDFILDLSKNITSQILWIEAIDLENLKYVSSWYDCLINNRDKILKSLNWYYDTYDVWYYFIQWDIEYICSQINKIFLTLK